MDDWKSIVHRGVESDELDYKAPMNWNELSRAGKAKIVRHVLALANTKGGFIVIGVAEDASGRPSLYRGLTARQCASFDPTPVIGFINSYADPPIDLAVERPTVDGRRYAIIAVKPFSTLPHVCANGVEGELQTGVFYIRTQEASSRAARRSSELHGIILRALRNQRSMLASMLRGILYENDMSIEETSRKADYFADEFSDLLGYFLHRHPEQNGEIRLEIFIAPERYRENRFSLNRLEAAAKEAYRLKKENFFIRGSEFPEIFRTGSSLRSLSDKRSKLWQLNKSGMIGFIRAMNFSKESGDVFDSDDFMLFCREFLSFAGRFYFALGVPEREKIRLFFRISPANGLTIREKRAKFTCKENDLEINLVHFSDAGKLLDNTSQTARRFFGIFREYFIQT